VRSLQTKPTLVVAVGVFFTALSSIFIRLSDAPPLAIATYRMAFTSFLLLPLFLREHFRKKTPHTRPEIDRPVLGNGRAMAFSVLSGLLLAAHFALWITSLSYTSVASATVLVTTHPILVGIFGFFLFGERVTRTGAVLMVTAVAGGFLLVWEGLGDGGATATGDLLALAGAVTVSFYMLIGRYVRRHLSVNHYTMIAYSVAFLALLILTASVGVPLWPYPLQELLIFAALALFCTLLGHSLFSWALKYLPTSVVSTSILGEPVIASILAVFLFGEYPTTTTFVGGTIILLSIFFFVRRRAAKSRPSASRPDR
jgi:drug/metabolite transporter (DMT)-like permease